MEQDNKKLNNKLSVALLVAGVSLGAQADREALYDEMSEQRVPSHFLRNACPSDNADAFSYDGNSSCSNGVCF